MGGRNPRLLIPIPKIIRRRACVWIRWFVVPRIWRSKYMVRLLWRRGRGRNMCLLRCNAGGGLPCLRWRMHSTRGRHSIDRVLEMLLSVNKRFYGRNCRWLQSLRVQWLGWHNLACTLVYLGYVLLARTAPFLGLRLRWRLGLGLGWRLGYRRRSCLHFNHGWDSWKGVYEMIQNRLPEKCYLHFISRHFAACPVGMKGLEFSCLDTFMNPPRVKDNLSFLSNVLPI